MSEFRKVFRDPVHNLIPLTGSEGKMILALIDRPEFQRLRRIRQLGLAFFVFPGAEHSRWVHSVGVFHVARRMLDALRERHGGTEPFNELEKIRGEILAAALLHDVGHGPFSHVFERAIPEAVDAEESYPTDHEEWTCQIIKDRFASTLEEHGIVVDVVTRLIDKTNREHLLAKDIISSQLDADRMDYLLRDSKAAGPKYGEFDLEWLLHSLRIGERKVPGQEGGVWRLCFDSTKAIHVIEEYLLARNFMYEQVYIHRTTRAYEALLTNVFRLAASICANDVRNVPRPCPRPLAKMLAGQKVTADEYLKLDDFRLWSMLADWAQLEKSRDLAKKRLGQMSRNLVCRHRPYKCIELDENSSHKAMELRGKLDGETSPARFSCLVDVFDNVPYRNATYRKTEEDEEQEDRVILVLDRFGKIRAAESESDLICKISELRGRTMRIYYDETDLEIVTRLQEAEVLKN